MSAGTAPLPQHIRNAVAGTLVTAALQVVVGVLLWSHRAEFFLAQARLQPELGADAVRGRAEGIVYGGLGTHLVLFLVYVVLTRGVLRASNGQRVRLTILLLAASVAGAVAAVTLGAQVPGIRNGMVLVQVVSTAIRLAVVYLLWVPEPSRKFFAVASAHRALMS